MKKILLLLCCCCSFTIFGQTVYGYELDSIGAYVQNDPELYQQLSTRFQAGDSTLNEIEFLVIYYGSAYLDSYSPYGETTGEQAMIALFNEEKYQEAIDMGEGILQENPAYAEMYFNVAVTYDKMGDTTALNRYLDLYYQLLSIPAFSGSGNTMDSAMVVRSVNDEYVLLREMGYGRPQGQSLVWNEAETIPYDVMKVQDEEGNDKDIYFNIYQPYILGLRKMLSGSDDKATKKKKKRKNKKERRKKKNKKEDN